MEAPSTTAASPPDAIDVIRQSVDNLMQFAEILYKCTLCTALPSILTSRDNFVLHLYDIHLTTKDTVFCCSHCRLKFGSREDLRAHIRAHIHGYNSVDSPVGPDDEKMVDISSSCTVTSECSEIPRSAKCVDHHCAEQAYRDNSLPMCDVIASEESLPLCDVTASEESETHKNPLTALSQLCGKVDAINMTKSTSNSLLRMHLEKRNLSLCPAECVPRCSPHSRHLSGNNNTDGVSNQNLPPSNRNKRKRDSPVNSNKQSHKQSHTIHWLGPFDDEEVDYNSSDQSDVFDCELTTSGPGKVRLVERGSSPSCSSPTCKTGVDDTAGDRPRSTEICRNPNTSLMPRRNSSKCQVQLPRCVRNNHRSDSPDHPTSAADSSSTATSPDTAEEGDTRSPLSRDRRTGSDDTKVTVVKRECSENDESSNPPSQELKKLLQFNTRYGGSYSYPSCGAIYPADDNDSAVNLSSKSHSAESRDLSHSSCKSEQCQNEAPPTFRCCDCDMSFMDYQSYADHCKDVHDVAHAGNFTVKHNQVAELVRIIPEILMSSHDGKVSRRAVLKEVQGRIEREDVEAWGPACNKAIKELFPYSVAQRKGKYKKYFFGVRFVNGVGFDDLDLKDEETRSSCMRVTPNRDFSLDIDRIKAVIPEIMTWRGLMDYRVCRHEFLTLLKTYLHTDEDTLNWGSQSNRAMRQIFPNIVIDRKGKYKNYYFGVCYKKPEEVLKRLQVDLGCSPLVDAEDPPNVTINHDTGAATSRNHIYPRNHFDEVMRSEDNSPCLQSTSTVIMASEEKTPSEKVDTSSNVCYD